MSILSPVLSAQDPIWDVDMFIGTKGKGGTSPSASVPYGLVQVGAVTRPYRQPGDPFYHFDDANMIGFRHLPGVERFLFGDVVISPMTGEGIKDLSSSPSLFVAGKHSFTHDDERASPGYYRVLLRPCSITAELTATQRTGMHRYTFHAGEEKGLIVQLTPPFGEDGLLELLVTGPREICGFCRPALASPKRDVYFVVRFSLPVIRWRTVGGEAMPARLVVPARNGIRVVALFERSDDPRLTVKIAFSSVGIEGARANLDNENPMWDFDAVRDGAETAWRSELSTILVGGGTRERRTVFYSAFFRCLNAVHVLSDIDGRFRGTDGAVHRASDMTFYVPGGKWKTYRLLHALLSMTDRNRAGDIVRSALEEMEEFRTGMRRSHPAASGFFADLYDAVPLVLDALRKDIGGIDACRALDIILSCLERKDAAYGSYVRHGYVSSELDRTSISRTLDFAYNDWCTARVAEFCGREDVRKHYDRQAQFWRNLYDLRTASFRPRVNGGWHHVRHHCCLSRQSEGSDLEPYSFFVPHDVAGLIRVSGGPAAFVEKLDRIFWTKSSESRGKRGDIDRFAQGGHCDRFTPYLYSFAGAPWKTQATVRQILDSLYSASPAGLFASDEGAGLSSWLVLSALGLCQLAPGVSDYIIGSPFFPRTTVRVGRETDFEVRAETGAVPGPFIRAAAFRGKPWAKSWFSYDEIRGGGTVSFALEAEPNAAWAASPSSCPSTSAAMDLVPCPVIHARARSFSDSLLVEIEPLDDTSVVRYTIEEKGRISEPLVYRSPVIIRKSARLSAVAVRDGRESLPVRAEFSRHEPVGTVRFERQPWCGTENVGTNALVDGVFADRPWQEECVCFDAGGLDAVIDLGLIRKVESVALSCLRDIQAGGSLPQYVACSFSENGTDFTAEEPLRGGLPKQGPGMERQVFRKSMGRMYARFIRVRARCALSQAGDENGGPCFCADEIMVHAR
ncbi:MAG: GH92 family glycosyl hydrolase [Bacteroidota bacterium]|nr:GH92 family glycosyl hydrolase [Bacteroidota bacterium]